MFLFSYHTDLLEFAGSRECYYRGARWSGNSLRASSEYGVTLREGRKFPSFPSHCLNYSKWDSSRFRWAQSHP